MLKNSTSGRDASRCWVPFPWWTSQSATRTRSIPADSLQGQFEAPFGVYGPPSMFPIPVLRYMKTHGITHEQIAMVAVAQRE